MKKLLFLVTPWYWLMLLCLPAIAQSQNSTPNTVRSYDQNTVTSRLSSIDTLIITGKADLAIKALQQLADDHIILTHDTLILQRVQLSSGKAWLAKEQFDQSLQSYFTSIRLAGKDTASRLVADAYTGIGVVYSRMRRFTEAEAYLLKALQLLPEEDKDRLKTLVNLVGVYMEEGNTTQTLPTHEQALALAGKLKAPTISAVLYTNLSNYYLKAKNWPQAITAAQQSIHLRDSLHKPLSVITCNNLGYALVQSGKVQEGITCYQQALPTATPAEKKQLLYNLANASNTAGNYKQAVQYLQQYDAVKDAIAQKQLDQKVAEITTRYETAQKQARISALESENQLKQKQLRQLITGTLLLLLLLAVIIYLRFKNLRVKQQLEQSRIKRQLLQVQLNPHFLFNALNQIQQYIYKNEAQKSMTYLNSFSRLMRLILESSDQETTTLEEEIEMLQHYITLQQAGTPVFSFACEVAPGLAAGNITMPNMLLQPFIENAVIHGVKKRENGTLLLSFQQKGNLLHVIITDNGKGIHNNQDHASGMLHRSMGRQITDQRIAEFNKTNRHKITLRIENSSSDTTYPGTTVHLYIPVNNSQ